MAMGPVSERFAVVRELFWRKISAWVLGGLTLLGLWNVFRAELLPDDVGSARTQVQKVIAALGVPSGAWPWLVVVFVVALAVEFGVRIRREIAALQTERGASRDDEAWALEAETLAREVFTLGGESRMRSPTDPAYRRGDTHATEAWQRDNLEQQSRAAREFTSKWATRVSAVFDAARRRGLMTHSELMLAEQAIAGYRDLEVIGKQLAAIASRVRDGGSYQPRLKHISRPGRGRLMDN